MVKAQLCSERYAFLKSPVYAATHLDAHCSRVSPLRRIDLTVDQRQELRLHVLVTDEKLPEAPDRLLQVDACKELEQVHYILSQLLVTRQQPEVGVQGCG
jgi:hypothetical protein